ncbi:MAG TPA: ABC transporter permease [Longimicrobiales bacterium]|nr:ABC transporter permease [Longimicrobiales bacterium]
MSRITPIIKREFTEGMASRSFIVGTVLGPLLIIGVFVLQIFIIMKSGGGEHHVAIVDATGRGLAERVAEHARERAALGPSFMVKPVYTFDTREARPDEFDAVSTELTERIVAEELDGFLWIPPDVFTGGQAVYDGSNATSSKVTGDLQASVQRAVHSERLRAEGIDEGRLGEALQAVRMNITKTGVGNPMAARMLAFFMAFGIYIVVMMYGQSIMSSVQEEKRDRIVELIVSSIHARDLLVGKVLGIGATGVVQMLIWVVAAGLLLAYGLTAAETLGLSSSMIESISEQAALPNVPLSVGVLFVVYFAGGFLLFATLFALIGSMVTNAQEAQQFVFPVLLPFIIGLFISMPAAENPNSTIATVGSFVPFTSPMVMPVRASATNVPLWQIAASVILLFATAALIMWLAAKIYRIAIFATGQKPTFREIVSWMRTA